MRTTQRITARRKPATKPPLSEVGKKVTPGKTEIKVIRISPRDVSVVYK